MNKNRTDFWRGFTWRRFFINFLFLFVFMLLESIVSACLERDEVIAHAFSQTEIIKRLILSIILGFIFAIWHEPSIDDRKKSQPKAE